MMRLQRILLTKPNNPTYLIIRRPSRQIKSQIPSTKSQKNLSAFGGSISNDQNIQPGHDWWH